MAHMIYSMIMSLDGYIEDMNGNLNWSEPSDEVHSFINDLERTAGTHLYGRRLYETMMVWETDPTFAATSPIYRDFAEIWQAAEKIVYSKTLTEASTRKTRIERDFDPGSARKLKATSGQDILIGGPNLAAHAFRAGLIDECRLFLAPIIIGGGKPAFPNNLHLELALLEEHRFCNGMVYLRYKVNQGNAI